MATHSIETVTTLHSDALQMTEYALRAQLPNHGLIAINTRIPDSHSRQYANASKLLALPEFVTRIGPALNTATHIFRSELILGQDGSIESNILTYRIEQFLARNGLLSLIAPNSFFRYFIDTLDVLVDFHPKIPMVDGTSITYYFKYQNRSRNQAEIH